MRNAELKQVGVLFLLGTMRSGTTYFRNVLSANNNFQVLGSELNDFWTKIGNAPCGVVTECPPRATQDATNEIKMAVRNAFFQQFNRRNHPVQLIRRGYRRIRYGNETLFKNGEPYFLLNKSTHLPNKLEYINEIFPDARFIYILRDIYSQSHSLARHFDVHIKKTPISIFLPDKPGHCAGIAEIV